MIKIEQEPIEIDARTAGKEFAKADCSDKVQFLFGLIDSMPLGTWDMQCRYISDKMKEVAPLMVDDVKAEVISYLESLVTHLKD